jgi:hypothetical protein
MQLGYWVAAERHLGEALASPRDPWVFRNRVELEQALRTAKGGIGELVITGKPDGAEVLVNGSPAGKLPLSAAVRLGEGPARVEVRAAGFRSSVQSLMVGGGKRDEIRFALDSVSADALGSGEPAASVSIKTAGAAGLGARRTIGWIAAGAAAAALGYGVIETMLWSNRRDEFDDHTKEVVDSAGAGFRPIRDCGTREPNRGGDECKRIYDEMSRAKTLAIVGYVGGALFAGAATAVLWGSREASPALSLSCVPSMGLAGTTCRLRF